MDIIIDFNVRLTDFIVSTANLLHYENCNYFYLGSQVIMYDLQAAKYSLITEHEYCFLQREVKKWIMECIIRSIDKLTD